MTYDRILLDIGACAENPHASRKVINLINLCDIGVIRENVQEQGSVDQLLNWYLRTSWAGWLGWMLKRVEIADAPAAERERCGTDETDWRVEGFRPLAYIVPLSFLSRVITMYDFSCSRGNLDNNIGSIVG